MDILCPRIRLRWLPAILGYASAGAVMGGIYGIVHDEVTYSLSPEYFTHLKFLQFHDADLGLPSRVFVAEIGFLATSWVGFVAGWFIARVSVPAFPPRRGFQYTARGFLIVFASAFLAAPGGYVLGLMRGSDYSGWEELGSRLGISELPGFVRVAYIHNAGYLGGLVGLIAAIIYLLKLKSRPRDELH